MRQERQISDLKSELRRHEYQVDDHEQAGKIRHKPFVAIPTHDNPSEKLCIFNLDHFHFLAPRISHYIRDRSVSSLLYNEKKHKIESRINTIETALSSGKENVIDADAAYDRKIGRFETNPEQDSPDSRDTARVEDSQSRILIEILTIV
jgi:hypothetical protein